MVNRKNIISLFVSLLSLGMLYLPVFATSYPKAGVAPAPMNTDYIQGSKPKYSQNNFFRLKSEGYNTDGTLQSNPVINAGDMTVGGVTYLLKKLQNNPSINFNGQTYIVYSAIPEKMTTGYAYENIKAYYDPQALTNINFSLNVVKEMQHHTVQSVQSQKVEKSVVPHSIYQVKVIATNYFLPNLLNASAESHDGPTSNVYWTVDPWIGNKEAQPLGARYHLMGYGWAVDANNVNKGIFVHSLNVTGGQDQYAVKLFQQPEPKFNYWMALLETPSGSTRADLMSFINNTIKANPDYPFPNPTTWLQYGVYFPIQPMPGFQRNLIRWYTPWGAWNLVNNTSGLFVRAQVKTVPGGQVELPVDNNGNFIPWVIQSWTGNQRYTVINQTKNVISSTYDLYPGSESYLAGNAFLPGKAGVLTTLKDYTIFDLSSYQGDGWLTPRESDLWLGLGGSTPTNVMSWDDANKTEPGGQANKPYMMGSQTYHDQTGTTHYEARLQQSNSFLIAELPQDMSSKLYNADFYINAGKGYQQVATLSYEWRPWIISQDGRWVKSMGGLGAFVPQISVENTNFDGLVVHTSTGQSWNPTTRVMAKWDEQTYKQGDANLLGKSPVFFKVQDNTTNGKIKFAIVLTTAGPDKDKITISNFNLVTVGLSSATVKFQVTDTYPNHGPLQVTAVAVNQANNQMTTANLTKNTRYTAQFSGLASGSTYDLTVNVNDGVNKASITEPGFIKTQGASSGITAPLLQEGQVTDKSIQVTWSAVTGTGVIYTAHAVSGAGGAIGGIVSGTQAVFENLKPGTAYKITVTAKDSQGQSATSQPLTITTNEATTTPWYSVSLPAASIGQALSINDISITANNQTLQIPNGNVIIVGQEHRCEFTFTDGQATLTTENDPICSEVVVSSGGGDGTSEKNAYLIQIGADFK